MQTTAMMAGSSEGSSSDSARIRIGFFDVMVARIGSDIKAMP